MKLLSVQVGQPKRVRYKGREVSTSIYKYPVEGSIKVSSMGLEGDTQSDLKVHGGAFKAVYAYPTEHLAYWQEVVPGHTYSYGAFGENLSTEGLLETELSIGDVLQVGTVHLRVTQPRFPCFKLGIKFDDPQMIKRFHESLKPGVYFEVLEEGVLQAGDAVRMVSQSGGVSIHDFTRAKHANGTDLDLIQRLLDDENLLDEWRVYFDQQVEKHDE